LSKKKRGPDSPPQTLTKSWASHPRDKIEEIAEGVGAGAGKERDLRRRSKELGHWGKHLLNPGGQANHQELLERGGEGAKGVPGFLGRAGAGRL